MNRSAFAVLVTLLMGSSSVHAYRTARDLPELQSRLSNPDEIVRWQSETFDYYLDLGSDASVSIPALERAVRGGLMPWQGVECASARFRYRGGAGEPASGDSRNGIGLLSSRWEAFGFPQDALAATDVLYRETSVGWEIVEADVWLNAWDHRWSTAESVPDGTRSVRATITHEIGHALGILHPCELGGDPSCTEEDRRQVMHPIYDNGIEALGPDDLAAICFLYPAADPPPCVPSCAPDEVCLEGSCRSRCAAPCGPGRLCDATGVCVQDEDCGPGCREGSFGDPCVDDRECASGVCVAGSCSRRCAVATDCGSTSTCVEGSCRTTGAFGASCGDGEECSSGVCLLEGREGYCTRPCGESCPDDTSCEPVDARDVCVIHHPVSGCHAATPPPHGPGTPFIPLIGLFAMLVARRRRQ